MLDRNDIQGGCIAIADALSRTTDSDTELRNQINYLIQRVQAFSTPDAGDNRTSPARADNSSACRCAARTCSGCGASDGSATSSGQRKNNHHRKSSSGC